MSLAYFCNTCWMAACNREARAYLRDTNSVRGAQVKVLDGIVRQNRDTWFGRKHRFASIRNVRDFQSAIPLSTYDDYRAAVERIANGEQDVLTADRVRLLEPTGGSTSGEKLIPFTTKLQHSFHRAIRLWIWDLYSHRPALRCGRSYWSITPLAQSGRRTRAGIPIGFDSDAQYLSRWERHFAQQTIIVPPDIARCPSTAAAQYATLLSLLQSRDLSLISVWSPTFLTALFQLLWANWENLADDLAAGRLSVGTAADNCQATQLRYTPQVVRAEELRRIFRHAAHVSECVPAIWPSLTLVSCWADGPSLVHANNLQQFLPGIEIQPKGLLATEAFVTVPLVACPAPALAIRSHFFEFQPAHATIGTNDTCPLLADELITGRHYHVIVTTAGGLYRYQLHDEVEAVGFKGQAPLLRFIGKTDDVSDLVGEKLHAAHVESALHVAFRELGLQPTFSQLRAVKLPAPGYVLQLAEPRLAKNPSLQSRLCRAVEIGLEANPGYHYARAIGQLRPLEIELLDDQQADSQTALGVAERLSAGQRLGDVKPLTVRH